MMGLNIGSVVGGEDVNEAMIDEQQSAAAEDDPTPRKSDQFILTLPDLASQ